MMLSPGQQAALGKKMESRLCWTWVQVVKASKQASKPTKVCDTVPLIQTTYT